MAAIEEEQRAAHTSKSSAPPSLLGTWAR